MTSFSSNINSEHNELDKRERKRFQNRMAQRVYRRNQKQRLQALEAAVANAASFSQFSPPQETEALELGDQAPEYTLDDPIWDIIPDPFIKPTASRTAFHRAICDGKESMINLLLEHGADIMKTDSSGRNALHLAAEFGSETVMKLLLSKTQDSIVTDQLGRTPLFSAVQGKNEATAKALLEASPMIADVNWKDNTGISPLYLAVELGFESIARLLLAHGADVNG